MSSAGAAPGRHRLPPGARPGAVRLQVADLERSLDYYRRVLGLRELERQGSRARLGTEDGGTPLLELHERPGAAPVRRGARLGLFHYALLLPERASLGRFLEHLAALGVPAGASDHLVSEALYLYDPDGLGIEVYADRPRAKWRREDGEIVMTTEPLDLGSLAAASEGEPWTGMPGGSRVGHVHLHVGDLERAEAFYHAGLGLEPTVRSYPGALFLSAGGYHHHLGVNTWAPEAVPPGADEARLLEWELLVPSVEEARRALERVRAAFEGAVEAAEHEGVATDPWGTAVRVRVDG